jgi:Cell division protein FtsI/penicillin-binding protein 2
MRKTVKKQKRKRIPAVFTRKMSEKSVILFSFLLLTLFFLSVAMLRINNAKGEEYTVKVLSQRSYRNAVLPYKRGDIIDRNGVTLATSIKVYNLILDPKLILSEEKFLGPTLEALNKCFGYDTDELTKLIHDNSKRSYLIYEKQLSYEQIKDFLEISEDTEKHPYVKGVTFESEYERKYPFSTLASSVIGFTVAGNVGNWGIEEQYNDTLNGVDGREYGYVNNDNIMERIIKNPTDGNNIISTLDFNIQTIVEKYIAQWKERYTPKNIGVIVMDPNNGEILAMAGDTNYDLNNPRDLTPFCSQEEIDAMTDEQQITKLNEIWRNYCISDTFEPGSTFKAFTVATALEQGLVNKNTTFVCDGGEQYPSQYVKCHKTGGHGTITLANSLAFSCNDAMMQISVLEGQELFFNYQKKFGFGSRTGVDLPGEASAATLLFQPENMTPLNLASCSFGQCFNVTMIQLAAGFCSLINGGYYYEPHIVSQIVKPNGSIVKNIKGEVIKQTVTKENSDYIKTGLRECVEIGTGKSAAVDGYIVSGKTGTAQKLTVDPEKYILSFIGFAPYEKPEIVCYVLVDDPVDPDQSSAITGTLFSSIMAEVLPYVNAKKDGPESDPATDPATQPESTTEPTSEPTSSENETTTQSNIGEDERANRNIETETTALPVPQ